MRKIYLAILFCAAVLGAGAQYTYNFAASSGTYTPIAGTSPTMTPGNLDGGSGGLDEGYSNGIPIGFSFNFNNTNYTTVNVASNGFLYFGASLTATSSQWVNNLMNGFGTSRPIIAPLWDDLFAGSIQYTTTGSAPNRVFTIQWANVRWIYNAAAPVLSFQVKLYEGTNAIQFVYDNLGGAVSSGSASIGLAMTIPSGGAAGRFYSLTNSGTSPQAVNSYESSLIDVPPASGQTYTFTPVAQRSSDIAVHNVNALGIAGQNASQTVTAVVSNLGTTAATNVPVTLNVSGANTHTQTVQVNIASGASTYVTFQPFASSATGTNVITVSVPADDEAANNSYVASQDIANNRLHHYDFDQDLYELGSITQNNEIAARFTLPYPNALSQVNLLFTTAGVSYDVIIYDVVADAPGSVIWSKTGLTSTANINNVAITPAGNVPSDFIVSIKQNGAAIRLYYQNVFAERPATFFFRSSGTWSDLAGSQYRIAVGITTDAVLPVQLTTFKGEARSFGNTLSWTTASEVNNRGFELERSADGKSFSTIAFVGSKGDNGNSNSQLSYTYNDERPLSGTNYYRLKQVDRDGKYSYSDIVTLKSRVTDFKISSLYPNPAINEVKMVITATNAGKATVVVTDLTGKVISQIPIQLMVGDNIQQIKVQSLATGTYMVKVIAESGLETAVQRFIKN